MNYTITEDRLKSIQFSYLDSLKDRGYAFSKRDTFIIIHYPSDLNLEEDTAIEYDYWDGRLYIDRDFLKTFESFFVFQSNGASIIAEWFKNKFDVEIHKLKT